KAHLAAVTFEGGILAHGNSGLLGRQEPAWDVCCKCSSVARPSKRLQESSRIGEFPVPGKFLLRVFVSLKVLRQITPSGYPNHVNYSGNNATGNTSVTPISSVILALRLGEAPPDAQIGTDVDSQCHPLSGFETILGAGPGPVAILNLLLPVEYEVSPWLLDRKARELQGFRGKTIRIWPQPLQHDTITC